jgi:ribosomal protein L1
MFAYKEILTLEDPRTLRLAQALPLPRGRRVEVLILDQGEEDDKALEALRDAVAARGASEKDVADAIAWARA